MQISVSIQAKKHFLQWFISHYQIETEEINWFIENLIEDERALFYLNFVQNIKQCPKGIIISILQTEKLFFQFFKGAVQTNDVYTVYHELHLYQDEPMYIQINFPQKDTNILYQAVLEEDAFQTEQDQFNAEKILTYLLSQGKKEYVKREIDNALDQRDLKKFNRFSKKLKNFDLL